MDKPNPAGAFIKAVTPTKAAVAEAISQKRGYLSQIVFGQVPSQEVRDKLARWGWRHVRELIDHLAALSPAVFEEQAAASLEALRIALPDEEHAVAE